MSYTLELSSDAGTFTFQTQPMFAPSFEYEYNRSTTPPTLTSVVERWRLVDCTFASDIDSDVTDHWAQLVSFTTDEANPIKAAYFKRNGTTIFSLDLSTHESVMLDRVVSKPGAGTWANNLSYDIMVSGRRYVSSGGGAGGGGVVKLQLSKRYEYDAAGLGRLTFTGRARTNGTSNPEDVVGTLTMKPPGDEWTTETTGPHDASYTIEDNDGRSISFTQVFRERRKTPPPGINEIEQDEQDASGRTLGETKTVTLRVKGDSEKDEQAAIDKLVSKLRADKQVRSVTITRDTYDGGMTATVTYREGNLPSDVALEDDFTAPVLIDFKTTITVSPGINAVYVFRVPGQDPIIIKGAKEPIRVIVNVRWRYIEKDLKWRPWSPYMYDRFLSQLAKRFTIDPATTRFVARSPIAYRDAGRDYEEEESGTVGVFLLDSSKLDTFYSAVVAALAL